MPTTTNIAACNDKPSPPATAVGETVSAALSFGPCKGQDYDEQNGCDGKHPPQERTPGNGARGGEDKD